MSTFILVESLADLRAREEALLREIAAYPNGGRLFLADPLRLLAEFGMSLAPAAYSAWTRLLNDPTALDKDVSGLYDTIKASSPTTARGQVRIRALLPSKQAWGTTS